MRLFKTKEEYGYEWSLVSAAQWQKYPNENCPHVSHVDVLNRSIDPETGVLITERLITVDQKIPTIIKKILGSSSTQYVREISIIDPKKKTFFMRSINLTMSNLLSVEETVVYKEHPEDSLKTQFSQQAAISAGCLVSGWSSILEEFSLRRFQQNAAVGRDGFNKVLEGLIVRAEAQSTSS